MSNELLGRPRNDAREPHDGAGGCPVKLGDRFSRKPAGFVAGEGDWCWPVTLVWTVIYINPRTRYYTAEAVCHGSKLRESFKF